MQWVADSNTTHWLSENARQSPQSLVQVSFHLESLMREGKPILFGEAGIGSDMGKFRDAIIAELRTLFCTEDEKYKDVRSSGNIVSKELVTLLAVHIGMISGVSAALATSGASLMVLAVLKVGVGAFCRSLNTDADCSCGAPE